MTFPEQGVHDWGSIGFCPRCGSHNIRIRQGKHYSQLWRCRGCRRTFHTPAIRETWFAKRNASNYVFAEDIPRMENRVRRSRGNTGQRRRRNPGKSHVLWSFAVVVLVALAAAWFWWANGTRLDSDFLDAIRSQGSSGAAQQISSPSPPNIKPRLPELSAGRHPESPVPSVVLPARPSVDPSVLTSSTATPDRPTAMTIAAWVPPTATPPLRLPTLIATPVAPHSRHREEKLYMLQLINTERTRAGAAPVVLGTNIAAQLHAESALANCFSGHWGLDGLKPYMRYSLAGGYQSNGENGHGSDYCIKASDSYLALGPIRQEIQESMTGWMASSGHRRNILDPSHQKVNIGIAWDTYNLKVFQHFEGDYVQYHSLPSISNGTLTLTGSLKNGGRLRNVRDLGVQIHYAPPPGPLTPGQVARSYCYDNGLQVASLREPLPFGSYWTENRFTTTYSPCPDPADVPSSAQPANSPTQANRLWKEAYDRSNSMVDSSIVVPWITSEKFEVNSYDFAVEADISDVLLEHGNGVYSIVVWGILGGKQSVMSKYSIFHGVIPPDTYTNSR